MGSARDAPPFGVGMTMPSPTRVLMTVSNPFTHDPRVSAEAQSLARAGYDVTVLAWDRGGTVPAKEVRDGVRIVRVRTTWRMKLLRYDIFRLRPFWRLAFRHAAILHRQTPFDVVHCHDLDTLPIGARLKETFGLRLVYDAHEIFPYMVELSRAKPWVRRFAELDCRLVPSADLVVLAGPAYQPYFSPLARGTVVVVTNSRPLEDGAYEPSSGDRMTIAYYGGFDPNRLLLPLAELAVEDDSFAVEIAGSGPLRDRLQELASRSRGNLRYLGMLSMAEVLPRTRKADVVFAVFDPAARLHKLAPPNKFFEALACGRPILVSKGTWVGDEVEAAGCGLAIEYSKAALREAIAALRQDPALRERMGRNALRFARDRYNWAREEATLLAAYDGLAAAKT